MYLCIGKQGCLRDGTDCRWVLREQIGCVFPWEEGRGRKDVRPRSIAPRLVKYAESFHAQGNEYSSRLVAKMNDFRLRCKFLGNIFGFVHSQLRSVAYSAYCPNPNVIRTT